MGGCDEGSGFVLAEVARLEARRRRDGFVSTLPVALQARVVALEELDLEVSALEARFRAERRELERKYECLYAHIFLRRAALLERHPSNGGDDARVPAFWLRAMKMSAAISANVGVRDEPALRSLQDVRCMTLPEMDGVGFRLDFFFGSNDFFTNSLLTKTYYLSDNDSEFAVTRTVGTDINWKPGQRLTARRRRRRLRDGCLPPPPPEVMCPTAHAVSGASRKKLVARSFFHLFATTSEVPTSTTDGGDGIFGDGGCSEALKHWANEIEAAYEVGLAFKEKLVPHAIRWVTGEAWDEDEYEADDGTQTVDDNDDEFVTDDSGAEEEEEKRHARRGDLSTAGPLLAPRATVAVEAAGGGCSDTRENRESAGTAKSRQMSTRSGGGS
eukprot:TRINITY_DN74816_c0_g1_i1.p1 TRINITY_DN74816_c0_g1~~TRINITY_DN74816_c0_g1_i1.p1  ORF type:complete len:386 (+),score=91.99 TRINITY_DN74816_c0_g1_i1:73-1230(+)